MSDEETIKIIEAEFESNKNTLPKEPEGDVKKEYIVGCENASDWQYIHEVLIQDGTLEDNIPNHCCESVDDCPHSATRGVYLLTSSEVEELKKHNKVFYVHINYKKYPGTYASTGIGDIASAEPANKTQRYPFTIESQRELWLSNTILDRPVTSNLNLRRDGFHLTRHMQKDDPWYGSANTTVINSTIEQYGTGKDVDVIVADTDAWFGHVEFQNNLSQTGSMNPTNYVGGNVLPGNGSCDALDLVLDAPYYIDPDFFNASPSTRLETRWDGTIVPQESVARGWWNINETTHRSSKFVSPSNGGTATGNNDFGTLSIISLYTRYRNNGSNSLSNMGQSRHGTPCMSQTYGRTHGWAYNANKWFVAIMGGYSIDYETYFDLLKIYHQIKPINPTYNTQDPTISSNSWGKRHSPQTAVGYGSAYYYFHAGTTGSGSINFSTVTPPAFLNNYWGGKMCPEYLESYATVEAAREMTESGVIVVAAAGNQNQKQVKSNHDDFDNYISTNWNTPLTNATTTNTSSQYESMPNATWYNTTNRRGFPSQAGVDRTTTPHTYPIISVGCLDHNYNPSGGGYGKEQKVGYSNMGNEQDVFMAGDASLGASNYTTNSTPFNAVRWDAFYDLSGNVSNTTFSGASQESQDRYMDGTSSACPMFAGLLATKVQYNRAWNYSDVRTWIQSLGQVDPAEFYYGSEGTTANASEWSDGYSLHGALGYVGYDGPTESNPEAVSDLKMTGNGLTFSGVSIKHT